MRFFFEYESVKDNLINYERLACNKSYSNKLGRELKHNSRIYVSFSNNKINECILLLRRGAYPYECMNDWEKVNEKLLLEKEEFYSNLNIENIINSDYNHAKRICDDFGSPS